MNQSVTPPDPCDQPSLRGGGPVIGELLVDDDFLSRLDEKLRLRNERLMGKLLAWGELLDEAGWSVALSGAGGDLWLSGRAKLDLQRLSDVPETWAGLLTALGGISAKSVHRKGEGVIVWAGHPPTKDASILAANLTQREAEVLSWLREGKSSPEIAIILGISTRTVEKHLANLYRKIGIKNRATVTLKYPKP